MANDNKPIWKDYPLYCGNGDYVIEELVNGTWQTRKRFHVLRTPYGGGEVAANDMLCADLKTGYPETTGVTTHSAAYRRYRCQTGSTASQTQVFNFCQDWSYDEWDGEARTLSAPINGHADMRQRLFRSRFGETEEEIEIREMVRPQFSFDYSSDVSADNTTGYLTVTANEDYTIYCGSSWIQNLNTGGTEGEQTFYFYIEPYTGFTDRSTVIEITYLGYEGNYETVELPLIQRAIVPFFNVYPIEQSVDYTSGTTVFVANTNVPFNVSENESWLELQGITQAGYQAYNVAFNYSANTGDDRQATVSFTFTVDATGGTQTVTTVIRQNRYPIIEVSSDNITITGIRHSQIRLYSDTVWNVVSSETWVTISPLSGNSGTTVIDIYCDFSTATREGNVVFENNVGSQATLTISQIPGIASNEMWYTSSNEEIVNPYVYTDPWNVNIVSNTYSDGYGKIVFDDDLTEIPNKAFKGGGFNSIWLPNSVQKIGSTAFTGNIYYNPINVYYMGTYNEWCSVTLGNNAFVTGKTAFHFITSSYTEVPYVIPNSTIVFGVGWSRTFPNNNKTTIVLDFIATGNTYSPINNLYILDGDGSSVYQMPSSFQTTSYRVRVHDSSSYDRISGLIGIDVTGLTHNSITIEEQKITNNITRQYMSSGWTRTSMTTATSLNVSSKFIGYSSIKVVKNNLTKLDCIAVLDENGVPGFYDKITKTFLTANGCTVFDP